MNTYKLELIQKIKDRSDSKTVKLVDKFLKMSGEMPIEKLDAKLNKLNLDMTSCEFMKYLEPTEEELKLIIKGF